MATHLVGGGHARTHCHGSDGAGSTHLTPYTETDDMQNKIVHLSAAEISEIIEMALSDKIGFEQIARQHGIDADEVKALMRTNLKPGSYRAWRKRVRRMRDNRQAYK